ncbi:MAG: SpoIIE family protein phosphatase [Oligoflexales bacterium]|nr:SpoIIE family protein phosphatase [Oligoflexales bacterium]
MISSLDKKTDIRSFSYFMTEKKLEVDDVVLADRGYPWKSAEGGSSNYGMMFDKEIWFHFFLKNTDSVPLERILYIDTIWAKRLDLVYARNGKIIERHETGTIHPRSTRGVDHRAYLFTIVIPPNDQTEVFIRYSNLSMSISFQLWEKTALMEHEQYYLIFSGGFIGLMLAMALYNSFIFMSIRDTAYLFYVIYVLFSMSFQLCMNGLFYQFFDNFLFIDKAHPWLNLLFMDKAQPWLLGGSLLSGMGFLGKFLRLSRKDSLIYFAYWCFFWATVFFLVMTIMPHGSLIYLIGSFAVVVIFLLIIPFAFMTFIFKLLKGVKEAIFIIIAWSGLLILCLLMLLHRFQLIHGEFFANMEIYAPAIGLGFETLLFSFALAEKIKIEKKLKEIAQSEAIENLKISDRIKRQIFANTSHELRTPLNGILGFLDLIKREHYGKVDAVVMNQIVKVQSLASSLRTQVNNILELAKSGEKRLTLNPSKILLNEIIEELKVIGEGLNLANTNSELTISKSWRTEDDPFFVSDHEKLFIIVRNLLANAFKFRDPNRKNSISIDFLLANDNSLVISIKDTGIGIRLEDQEKIFEEFFQVEGNESRRYEGTGLGLSIVRRYLEIIGGQIKVNSEIGKGTQFVLSIFPSPVLEDGNQALKDRQAENTPEAAILKSLEKNSANDSLANAKLANQQEHFIGSGSESKKMKILIVDDHKYNCEVIRDILHTEGYQVEMALGGEEGIEKMKSFLPDLILLDMMMPGLSGGDFIKFTKNDEKFHKIPVVFITARSSEDDLLQGLKMGADDYLTKPILSEELKLRVGNIFSRIICARTQSERETIIKNIGLIQEVHESFSSLSKQIPQIRVADCYQPAENVGGDWRAIFHDEKNQILEILIGDVTGHGISSAIYTVAAAGAIKNTISMLDNMTDKRRPIDRVKIIATHLNSAILETSMKLNKMMTMIVISINLENGHGAILNAGHHPCLLGRRGEFKPLLAQGNPIGTKAAQEFECSEFQFFSGDILFLYTDGLVENRGLNGKKLTLTKLRQILARSHDVDEIKKEILDILPKLWCDDAIEDDYSFLVIQRQ